ncbi:hypothetical protein M422DRAFT_30928 [Sphaerobolus stellatus SS14]|uniref:Uncharacterized protein n=1 Tax=Sphaerobolus stellatus (strain SS14) TaxID=990650 RepID=A0A0C9VMR9_SPHS4|nr:hypothetical protein M422DRAFT_30928 [Sphaerobolus stellatus SS14]
MHTHTLFDLERIEEWVKDTPYSPFYEDHTELNTPGYDYWHSSSDFVIIIQTIIMYTMRISLYITCTNCI